MRKQDFLLEIGCEEIPARLVSDTVQQLAQLVTGFLQENRIEYGSCQPMATPRRLAIQITELAEYQTDQSEEIRGPALRIAQTEQGTWSKAAEGFARKQGVAVEDLVQKEYRGEIYVYATQIQTGQPTQSILSTHLAKLVDELRFPKTMRWNQTQIRFIRPIRWLVCLMGDQVLPVSIAGLTSDRISWGHRFLGEQIRIPSAREYISALREVYVLVDIKEREQCIRDQLQQLEKERGWRIPISSDLLQEVVQLVEYPTALSGQFDQSYLSLPRQVLTTTMREHQRYFSVENQQGDLLPYFVTIRNGNERSLDQVARGNERVLRARLADAQFFYETDQLQSIDSRNQQLETIVYQEELGTVAERVQRLTKLVDSLGKMVNLSPEKMHDLQRAAKLSKMDLATLMVDEYSKLEGYMGAVYARLSGEKESVALAIEEQYYPRHSGDHIPTSELGTILSLADKIDAIVGSINIGIEPSASQDPYGLRKRANAVLQILLQKDANTSLTLYHLCHHSMDTLEQQGRQQISRQELERKLQSFFRARVQYQLQERAFRHDVILALAQVAWNGTYLLLDKAQFLQMQLQKPSFKEELEGFTRVANLAVKSGDQAFDPTLPLEPVEQQLYDQWKQAKQQYSQAKEVNDVGVMYEALRQLVPSIHQYFDQVMVMVEDDKIRNNRLALLRDLTQLVYSFADFSELIWE